MENTNVKILKILKQLGIAPDLLGYKYLAEAIDMVLKDDAILHSGVTKILYPTVAKKFNTTPSRVERAIRHAVERAISMSNIELIEEIFGSIISMNTGKPTNSQFIGCVAEYVEVA